MKRRKDNAKTEGNKLTKIEDKAKPEDFAPNNFIHLNEKTNSFGFRFQNGPIKESGVNGCQVDCLIEAAKLMLESFQKSVPSRQTALAITKLDEALLWLKHRTEERERRGIEGTGKA